MLKIPPPIHLNTFIELLLEIEICIPQWNSIFSVLQFWLFVISLGANRAPARESNASQSHEHLEYYKTAALFWETYAKNIEAELAKQGKKN